MTSILSSKYIILCEWALGVITIVLMWLLFNIFKELNKKDKSLSRIASLLTMIFFIFFTPWGIGFILNYVIKVI